MACRSDYHEWIQGDEDILCFWSRDIGDHHFGQFSMAVLQSNRVIEDKSQVEVAEDGSVFCGIYDGHGGAHASTYVLENLYPNFRRLVTGSETISANTVLNAFKETEKGFVNTVEREFQANQDIAVSGSCCLVGIITSERILHYANLGNSRAVLGYQDHWSMIQAAQLSEDHDLNLAKAWLDHCSSHPGSDLLGNDGDNGKQKLTRCIGDVTYKGYKFDIGGRMHRISESVLSSLMTAIPSTRQRKLRDTDRFIIFATRALWEVLTNWEAVNLVIGGPRERAARRLVKEVMRRRAKKAGITYDDLRLVDNLMSRSTHVDDVSVIVLFVDKELLKHPRAMASSSVKGFEPGVDDGI